MHLLVRLDSSAVDPRYRRKGRKKQSQCCHGFYKEQEHRFKPTTINHVEMMKTILEFPKHSPEWYKLQEKSK